MKKNLILSLTSLLVLSACSSNNVVAGLHLDTLQYDGLTVSVDTYDNFSLGEDHDEVIVRFRMNSNEDYVYLDELTPTNRAYYVLKDDKLEKVDIYNLVRDGVFDNSQDSYLYVSSKGNGEEYSTWFTIKRFYHCNEAGFDAEGIFRGLDVKLISQGDHRSYTTPCLDFYSKYNQLKFDIGFAFYAKINLVKGAQYNYYDMGNEYDVKGYMRKKDTHEVVEVNFTSEKAVLLNDDNVNEFEPTLYIKETLKVYCPQNDLYVHEWTK